jgi:hypothetical protein
MSNSMDKEISVLLHDVPAHADYACNAVDLDLEDIPEDRIKKVINLLNSSDESTVFEAAKILTHWGQTSGFDTLVNLLNENKLDGYIDHCLHGYDDTLQHVLRAFVSYWATQSDLGLGEQARIKIFPPIQKIIEKSNTQVFDISGVFWVIKKYKYSEYIPLIRNHLIQIIDHPKLQFWKIHDAIELMLKLDPDFVHNLLKQKGKALKDFKIDNS